MYWTSERWPISPSRRRNWTPSRERFCRTNRNQNRNRRKRGSAARRRSRRGDRTMPDAKRLATIRKWVEREKMVGAGRGSDWEFLLSLIPDWQPISVAPKDGTPVLAFVPSYFQKKGGMTVAHWMRGSRTPDGAWYDGQAWEIEPTHWQCLPSPPETRE